MWILILAIVILLLSAIQTAYYVECMKERDIARPLIFISHERLLIYTNIIFLIAGFTLLFIVIGWWGFVGLAIYWILVVFVLLPIGMQRLVV